MMTIFPPGLPRRQSLSLIACLGLFSAVILLETRAYAPALSNSRTAHRVRTLPFSTQRFSSSSNYGRGAEIWPPANEGPIKLADSFPNRKIPDDARETLRRLGTKNEEEKKKQLLVEWRKLLPRAMERILRRAASAQEEEAFLEPDAPSMDKTPAVVALALLSLGYVRSLDVALVGFLSSYFVALATGARSLRKDGVTPVLPALPPQGHVPVLVSNPLGPNFTYSIRYDRWLKLGVLTGLLAPLLMSVRYGLTDRISAATLVLRPLFFLCCQAVSEAVSRRVMTPLPLRILVPISYNAIRLGYLWQWTFSPEALGLVGRGLAGLNLVYWSLNLFAFLIPVATMRYMRAHFLCVEFEQVTTRSGMEESVGLQS